MIVVQFAAEIKKTIRAEMNDLADFVAGGGCTSIEHYRDICGKIHGLATAERMILDAAERLERGNDDGN